MGCVLKFFPFFRTFFQESKCVPVPDEVDIRKKLFVRKGIFLRGGFALRRPKAIELWVSYCEGDIRGSDWVIQNGFASITFFPPAVPIDAVITVWQ